MKRQLFRDFFEEDSSVILCWKAGLAEPPRSDDGDDDDNVRARHRGHERYAAGLNVGGEKAGQE